MAMKELPAQTAADRPARERITLYEALAAKGMSVGSVVQSLAGHDYGRLSLILVIRPPFTLIADGKYRTTANPKQKRLSHLRLVGEVDQETLKEVLELPEEGQRNSAVRRLIRRSMEDQNTDSEVKQAQDRDQNP